MIQRTVAALLCAALLLPVAVHAEDLDEAALAAAEAPALEVVVEAVDAPLEVAVAPPADLAPRVEQHLDGATLEALLPRREPGLSPDEGKLLGVWGDDIAPAWYYLAQGQRFPLAEHDVAAIRGVNQLRPVEARSRAELRAWPEGAGLGDGQGGRLSELAEEAEWALEGLGPVPVPEPIAPPPSEPSVAETPIPAAPAATPEPAAAPAAPVATPAPPVVPATPTTPTPAPAPATQPSRDVAALARETVDLINQERTVRGLRPLRIDDRLMRASQDYAELMARTGRYSHHCEGSNGGQRSAAAGFPGSTMEVLAADRYRPVENVTGWLNSPGHRAALLHDNINVIGVGTAEGPTGVYYVGLVGLLR